MDFSEIKLQISFSYYDFMMCSEDAAQCRFPFWVSVNRQEADGAQFATISPTCALSSGGEHSTAQ